MKSKKIAALLAFFIGGLGGHKFYLGQTAKGIVYLVFCWTYIPAIVGVVEAIQFLAMSQEAFDKKYNKEVEISKPTITPMGTPYNSLSTSNASKSDFKSAAEHLSQINKVKTGGPVIPPQSK